MPKLVLPKSFYENEDKPGDGFLALLRDLDPLLLCYWNRFKGRWVIDRYSCANDGHEHQFTCPRLNVLIVQSDEGEYMPLNDRVLEKLRSMDQWAQHKSAEQWDNETAAERDAIKQRVAKSIRDDVRHIILDNKEQFKRIQTAIQTHDLRPNDIGRANKGADAELSQAVIGQRSPGDGTHG